MISGEEDVASLARERDAVVRLRAVADHVAEAPDRVHAGAVHVGKDGFECGTVPIHVGEERDADWLVLGWGEEERQPRATATGDPGGGGRRRGGRAPAAAPWRTHRAGPGRRDIVLHRLPAGACRGLPRGAAPDRRGRPRGERAGVRAPRGAAAAGGGAARSAAAAGRRRGRGGD